MNHPQHLLLYCRPGFEKECAAEIIAATQVAGIYGYVKAKADSGYVIFHNQSEARLSILNHAIRYSELIFARQCIFVSDIIKDLPADDRVTPLLEHLHSFKINFQDAWLETADTNEGKQLNAFLKKFTRPLLNSLELQNLLDDDSEWRLHLFFLSSSAVYLGISNINNSAPVPMGIPRLRMPRSAPSRSTLKLDEAFNFMLSTEEQRQYLKNGMTAVDLGAAPGGWTWQLVNRGIRVIAIDNGPMNTELMDTGLVHHERADGFKYTPEKPVDWLVCDMVERPLHISRLMARWLTQGHCQYAAFNLKLPMKSRYPVVMECLNILDNQLQQAQLSYRIRAKQLYHDREEITCIVLPAYT